MRMERICDLIYPGLHLGRGERGEERELVDG